MNRFVVKATALIAAALISSCSGKPPSDALVDRGEELYQANCASCHGSDLAGAPNWRTPNEDGSFPPPPQDSSGHTWHHPDQVLIGIIRDGSAFPESRMPAFGDQLSDDDIKAILEFIKTSWGPQERAFQAQLTDQYRP